MAGSYGRRWAAVPLIIATAVVATGCGGDEGDGTWKPAMKHTDTATTAAGQPHTLVFKITGRGRITSLTYTINGKPTTLRNLTIPWTKTIELPASAGTDTWSLHTNETLTSSTTQINDTAYVDDTLASHGGCYGTPGTSCSGSLSGSIGD
jgi:Rieske Fe-S protein